MKLLPNCKTFKEEATIWTHRLNRMSEIFEKWIDVQHQWVYFEAIFSGNTDIKHRLPNASNQFNMIHTKYLGLMKHVSKSPYIYTVNLEVHLLDPGKTESVKALGVKLGQFVLVFCCDEIFDFQAMGRIFVGLCQVGAWGCFDEANRLEERILSAVSQQIQSIQQGLKAISVDPKAEVELVGKTLKIFSHTVIFITMNLGYAGQSNLPENLKKLFRSMAITRPDRELIAQLAVQAAPLQFWITGSQGSSHQFWSFEVWPTANQKLHGCY
ncbi:hypothetical protein PGTUg99_000821 [Puccinia graminis f. sp. tritici]|uniref:Dynein heavy chain, cytoplasmic n=1 Tax=Puccinia graminis f. sp. tritici TaxID=56615 RepID=A0A5B0QYM5_PUCGR|nr:hypothetical protein PGTUg99_000821 [Puccinia graminis f. sp. tritici]